MEKIKADIYVRGDIIADEYAACIEEHGVAANVAEDDPRYDLSGAIRVDGDMRVGGLAAPRGKFIAASGSVTMSLRT